MQPQQMWALTEARLWALYSGQPQAEPFLEEAQNKRHGGGQVLNRAGTRRAGGPANAALSGSHTPPSHRGKGEERRPAPPARRHPQSSGSPQTCGTARTHEESPGLGPPTAGSSPGSARACQTRRRPKARSGQPPTEPRARAPARKDADAASTPSPPPAEVALPGAAPVPGPARRTAARGLKQNPGATAQRSVLTAGPGAPPPPPRYGEPRGPCERAARCCETGGGAEGSALRERGASPDARRPARAGGGGNAPRRPGRRGMARGHRPESAGCAAERGRPAWRGRGKEGLRSWN